MPGLHSDVVVRSWCTTQQSEREFAAELLPLREVEGHSWYRAEDRISHERGLYFSTVPVDVVSRRPEVTSWSQPLLEPHGMGVAAILVRRIGGVPHCLVHARVELGYLNVVNSAPRSSAPRRATPISRRPPGPVSSTGWGGARPERILFDTVLSEEGGRFLHARNRSLIVETDADTPADVPDECRWVTLRRLGELLKYSHHVNVQARTLVAALRMVGGSAVRIIGDGFLGRNLAATFGDRFPDVTAVAAGVSSTSTARPAQYDREAEVVHNALEERRRAGR
ncbi:NDP-hexose 2,3-dehydratase family protein [Streptomyces lasiicapitis]|uniref:NDP-hexose 2,3-dehydratase family protein n=1 Tax=Streptomyces lasiicapitis TaxID=1923961 RepID=UPI00365DA610